MALCSGSLSNKSRQVKSAGVGKTEYSVTGGVEFGQQGRAGPLRSTMSHPCATRAACDPIGVVAGKDCASRLPHASKTQPQRSIFMRFRFDLRSRRKSRGTNLVRCRLPSIVSTRRCSKFSEASDFSRSAKAVPRVWHDYCWGARAIVLPAHGFAPPTRFVQSPDL